MIATVALAVIVVVAVKVLILSHQVIPTGITDQIQQIHVVILSGKHL